MRSRLARALIFTLALLLATAAALFGTTKTYEVRGLLQSYNAQAQEARIAHEEIAGCMPAMTMTFKVEGEVNEGTLHSGDSVRFTLHVTDQDAWIDHLQNDASETKWPFRVEKARVVRQLQPGDTFPDAQLIDQNGALVHLREFKGQALAITFIYLGCPLPTYCPLMNNNFRSAENLLHRLGLEAHVKLLSISMDQARDTPERLREVASSYGAEPRNWVFASVSEDQLKHLADATGLEFSQANGQIVHNLRTLVIDREFRLRRSFAGNSWTPQELVAEITATVENSNE